MHAPGIGSLVADRSCRHPARARAGRASAGVVAIPVRNEAARIGDCLAALVGQRDLRGAKLDPRIYEVLLLFNNCTDESLGVACRAAAGTGLRLRCLTATLPTAIAHVGWARGLAMKAGALRLRRADRPDGVILTTDANSQAAPDWIAMNLRAIDAGADLVAGVVEPEPEELAGLSERVRRRRARVALYHRLLDRLAHVIDPDPADPWPRHSDEPGASLAIRLDTFERIGGLPPEPWNEDRALVRAVRQIDGRIRHAPEVRVRTSCRLDGRAEGGMAATLRRWHEELPASSRLETQIEAARRWLRTLCRPVGTAQHVKTIGRMPLLQERPHEAPCGGQEKPDRVVSRERISVGPVQWTRTTSPPNSSARSRKLTQRRMSEGLR